MSKVKVSLSDQTVTDIERLVEQGEFINQDQAIEDLLKRGVSAYNTTEESTESELDDQMFGQTAADQQDPAMQDDDYGF
ncbi:MULTISPECIES: DUF7120 family protein [Haloarcula]|uniref:DUF7120 family protein n=1 Tax=Haloarcula TaxID=2237 RepID=UPI0023E4378F|nr:MULTISPECIES: CopG family transcriptional regulator [Haloarculaceae]